MAFISAQRKGLFKQQRFLTNSETGAYHNGDFSLKKIYSFPTFSSSGSMATHGKCFFVYLYIIED
jgi:hypothetical protein